MEKIGMLTIVYSYKDKGRVFLSCICDCGNTKAVRKDHIGEGKTISCGCYGKAQRIKAITKHGLAHTRLYTIWLDMKQRCGNPKNTAYLYYGYKGISVCSVWEENFIEFYAWAMSSGYSDLLTLDRINSDGSYAPENCRWLTQEDNTRRAHLGKKHIRRSITYGK